VEAGASVVQLPEPEYGLLDGDKLEGVRRLLLDLANQPGPLPLIVDCSKVHFIGASFIGVLVDTWDQLKNHNQPMALCGLMPYCARLVRVLHLDKLFDIYPTGEIALEKIGNHSDREAGDRTTGRIRIEESKVAWDANMVRLEYVGDDDFPIRSVIVPRQEGERSPDLSS
jgi:anti-anti-sigma factor